MVSRLWEAGQAETISDHGEVLCVALAKGLLIAGPGSGKSFRREVSNVAGRWLLDVESPSTGASLAVAAGAK